MFFLAKLDCTLKIVPNQKRPKLGKNFIQFVFKEFLGSSFGYRNPILDNTDVGSIWKLMMAFIFCEWSATKKELYPLWSFHIFLFYVSFL